MERDASNSGSANQYTGLSLETLPGYLASFELYFTGESSWRYQLETRANRGAVEYRLHIEGPGAGQNPGDVRMVTEAGVSRMLGPGTEGQCVQFPADIELGPAFLTPDHVIPPAKLNEPLQLAGQEAVAGVEAQHFRLQQENLERWRDIQINLWRDEGSGATLAYDLLMSGPDPVFDGGEGILAGRFRVTTLGPQVIEPIAGCEIDLPLPDDAARVVKLPGLIAYDSATPAQTLIEFYQTELAQTGWEPAGEPQSSASAVLLSYRYGERELDINIEPGGEATHVELLLNES